MCEDHGASKDELFVKQLIMANNNDKTNALQY